VYVYAGFASMLGPWHTMTRSNFLDFQKAFDKVPHKRLLHKVAAHGIRGELLLWIENWLSGRKQRVTLNGQCSSWKDVLSGVLQGSVLVPILFLIYINDIGVSVACKVLKNLPMIHKPIYTKI